MNKTESEIVIYNVGKLKLKSLKPHAERWLKSPFIVQQVKLPVLSMNARDSRVGMMSWETIMIIDF